MRERVLALRAAIEPELAANRAVEFTTRPAISQEPAVAPYRPPKGSGRGYHHKVTEKRAKP